MEAAIPGAVDPREGRVVSASKPGRALRGRRSKPSPGE